MTEVPFFQHVTVRRPAASAFELLLATVNLWWPGADERATGLGGELRFVDGALVHRSPDGRTEIVGAARPTEPPYMLRIALTEGTPEHTVQFSCATVDDKTQVVLVEEGWARPDGRLLWPELTGPDREATWISALTRFGSISGDADPMPAPILPFAPPVVGVSPEEARRFLDGRRTMGRVPLPPPPGGYPPPPPESPPPPSPRPEPSPVVWTGAPMPAPDQWATPADFPWAQRISEASCVALVHGRTPRDVLAELSAPDTGLLRERVRTPVLAAQAAREWAWAQTGYFTALEAGRVGDWTLLVEENGYQINEARTVGPLSVGTAVAVIYWTVTGRWHFWWAVDGTIVRSFGQEDVEETTLTGRKLPQEEGFSYRSDWSRASGFALLQRLTGVLLREQDLRDDDRIALGIDPG